ncbi:hypothetical protein L1049_026311 [Liquidambar formosana]|uniref:Myb-like domain-containing protein n=1 Tax=Liquidambar formosana TaxID=63359 RepID=A0AAP0NDF2_LIQFO
MDQQVAFCPLEGKENHGQRKEDMELIAAVQKCGEGNWANILRGDFKGDRTASQLSQRWAIIRKRHRNLNVGVANSTGSQLSEAQLAARHAMSLALNMPVGNLAAPSSLNTAATNSNTGSSNPAIPTAPAEVLPGSGFPQTQHQSQPGPIPTSSRIGSFGSASKSRVTLKKMSSKSTISPDSMVKATAVAAGARIATPEDAASLLKAAQAKNAVHIMHGRGSLNKSSKPGGANHLSTNHLGAHHNVHYVCTGMEATPLPAYPAVTPSASKPGSAKPVPLTVPLVPSNTATSSSMSSEQTNPATPSLAVEFPSQQEVKTAEEIKVSGFGNTPKEQVQENQTSVSGNAPSEQVQEDQAALPVLEDQLALGENLNCSLNKETAENDQVAIIHNPDAETQNVNDNKMMSSPVKEGCENQSTDKENREKQADLPSVGSSDRVEVLDEAVAGTDYRARFEKEK